MAAFVVLAVVTGVQLYLTRAVRDEPGTLTQALIFGMASWIVWAAASPAIVALGRRFDFSGRRRLTSALLHLAAVIVINVPATLVVTISGFALYGERGNITRAQLVQALINGGRLQVSILVYAAILGLGYAVRLYDQLRHRDVQAAQLKAQAAQAQLEALGMRLQPHFLFNTLHSISALVDENPSLARTVIADFGELLRDVLAAPIDAEVTLAREVEFLARYLAIEQLRFADRLTVDLHISPDTLEARVPRLLLQPLVENAIRHGIAHQPDGGTVEVSASRHDGQLCIRVWNSGSSLLQPLVERTGIATTRARLQARHGETASLRVQSRADGVESLIDMPLVLRA